MSLTNNPLRWIRGAACAAVLVWCISGHAPALGAERPAPLAERDAGQWGKDPFGSPPEPVSEGEAGPMATAGASPDLEGIIAGPSGVVAIMNGRIVRVGDHVNGEWVRDITPNAVTLQRGQQIRRIGLRAFTLP